MSAAINGYHCDAGEDFNEKEECDRQSAALPLAQLEAIEALAGTGVPLVLVLTNGGALEVDFAVFSNSVRAIIHAPYLGIFSGEAVAATVLGMHNPAGRLTATWYTSTGLLQIGGITEYRMRAENGYPGRTHRYLAEAGGDGVAFPFGYGLSFGSVAYSAATVSPNPSPCDAINVSFSLTNNGAADVEEVAQLYLSHGAPTVPVPVRALVAFQRVRVPAGRSVDVALQVLPRQNAVLRAGDLAEEVQPGPRSLWLGGCSEPRLLTGVRLAFTTVGVATPLDVCEQAVASRLPM